MMTASFFRSDHFMFGSPVKKISVQEKKPTGNQKKDISRFLNFEIIKLIDPYENVWLFIHSDMYHAMLDLVRYKYLVCVCVCMCDQRFSIFSLSDHGFHFDFQFILFLFFNSCCFLVFLFLLLICEKYSFTSIRYCYCCCYIEKEKEKLSILLFRHLL